MQPKMAGRTANPDEGRPGSGGARPGAGRPAGRVAKQRQITITDADVQHLLEKYGTVSGGIRTLIERDREPA